MILTPAQLAADCLKIEEKAYEYQPAVAPLITVLHLTGCRQGEVLDRARWSLQLDDSWILYPQKGNSPRVIPAQSVPLAFKAWVLGSGYPFKLSSLTNLRRITDLLSLYPLARCGDKEISTHRFRHNYAKKLSIGGASIAEIKADLGLSSTAVTSGYVNSVITSD